MEPWKKYAEWIPRKEVEYSDKEPLPEVGWRPPYSYGGFGPLMGILETVDRLTAAPVRAGLMEGVKAVKDVGPLSMPGKVPYSFLKGLLQSYGNEGIGPTGKQVAEEMGISPMSFKEAAGRGWQNPDLYPDVSPAGIAGTGVEAYAELPIMGLGAMIGKKVYHGSPHKFDKFNIEHIGSGEGNQVFGHGLYFADDPEIAKSYAETLGAATGEDAFINLKGVGDISNVMPENELEEQILKSINDAMGDGEILESLGRGSSNQDEVAEWAERVINDYESDLKRWGDLEPEEEKLLSEMRKKYSAKNMTIENVEGSKHFYTVRIPEGNYLKWNDKLSEEQKKKLHDAIWNWKPEKMGFHEKDIDYLLETFDVAKDENTASLYMTLSDFFGSHKKASQFLNAAGIKGIEYPSGTLSGIKGSKAKNYVLFSDEGISIEDMKKLMLLGAAGVGTGAAIKNKNGPWNNY